MMAVGILKKERLDSTRVLVPVRQALGAGRGVLDLLYAEVLIRLVHVAHDDGDVLKPAVVAARVERDWPTARRQELSQVKELRAQLHPDDSHPQAEDAG
jgi:hypothetical protein